jgi:hypothetical protein
VAELTTTGEEVASLQIKEVDTHWDATEAKEKFTALTKRARLDATKTKQLWNERDKLLQTTMRLR